MRTGIEKLAWRIDRHSSHDPSVTIGELASIHDETPERIMDAIDVLKIRRGEPTQIPPVAWSASAPDIQPQLAPEVAAIVVEELDRVQGAALFDARARALLSVSGAEFLACYDAGAAWRTHPHGAVTELVMLIPFVRRVRAEEAPDS